MNTHDGQFEARQLEWLDEQFRTAVLLEKEILRPSEWAAKTRYLPPSVTPQPGVFRWEVTPYMREILDCLGMDSPVREVALKKGAQISATTAILENLIGYCIDHVRNVPVMLVTADAELAKLRLDSYITPMIQQSGLTDRIQSVDEHNPRKTGSTEKKIEWVGGGSLVLFGANNANKFRSITAQVLLNDEVDGWPDTVGKDGDPVRLIRTRAAAYEARRKILDLSTPLLKGTSKIDKLFERGDQRYYNVKCLRCFVPQVLRWHRVDNETGEVSGIVWEMDGDRLIPESVRYCCQHCGHPHTEHDKKRLFAEGNAEWVPTAEPVERDIRSYHLSALYSTLQSWAACVQKWLEAWDVQRNQSKDEGKLQVFYNNVLGETYEVRGGKKIQFKAVSAHRRAYSAGQIPNKFAAQFCGGTVQLLTCSVDVHGDCLKVAVWGWAPWRRAILVEYLTLEGDPEQLDDPGTWGELSKLIEDREYVADDGRKYRLQLTVIDSGFLTDTVYEFCYQYQQGVHPIKGVTSTNGARQVEFVPFTTKHGTEAFGVNVDLYKDRWSASLRREWDGVSQQSQGHFNVPMDVTDAQLKELTVETKNQKVDKKTGKVLGYEWHRPPGSANELWDLLIYGNAALDLIVWSSSRAEDLTFTDWRAFWEACEAQKLYFTPA